MKHPQLLLLGGILSGAPLYEAAYADDAENRVKALEERVRDLEQMLKSAGKPVAARTEDPDTVKKLDQKVRTLERRWEVEREDAEAQKQNSPIVSLGESGFSVKSPDGAYQLQLRGLLQAHGYFFSDDHNNTASDTFTLRRARLIFQGKLAKYFDYFIMPDFGGNSPALIDAFVDVRYQPEISLRAGRFVSPFGLEHIRAAGNISFVERALPDNLVPDRDNGAQLFGELGEGAFEYALAVANGVVDGGTSQNDTSDAKEFVGRVFAHPFQSLGIEPLRGLGLGIAGTFGEQEGALPSYKTSGRQTFFTYRNGVVADGDRYRISPQLFYNWDSFSVLSEYVLSSQEIARGGTSETLENDAWQVALSYVLTGENIAYKTQFYPVWANGMRPRHGFDPLKRNKGPQTELWAAPFQPSHPWGALEVVARYNRLDVDRKAFPVYADPSSSARSASAWALGLNWYLNSHFRLTADYEQTDFSGGKQGGDRPKEKVAQVRFQAAF
jgi:phosphate-selective porin OprO/OprP